MSALALLLAHQGGWDETLVVLAPIALFGWLLHLANRRATRAQAEREHDHEHDKTLPHEPE